MKRLLLMLLLLGAGSATGAGLYKWVDENGKVIYSDTPPPPTARESKSIAAPARADPSALKALDERRQRLQKAREADAQQAKKEAEEASRAAEAQVNCAQWRGELTALDRGTLGARIDEKGDRVVLDEKQLSRRRADLQRWIADTCRG